jgi:hypothetical protein
MNDRSTALGLARELRIAPWHLAGGSRQIVSVAQTGRRVSQRDLRLRVATTGILSVTFATALATHSVLELAQSARLLGGDYGDHAHGAVIPVAIAAVTGALLASLLYAVHLIGEGPISLPSLAQEFRAKLGWRTIPLSAIAACLVLIGMETAEQLAAGHFDGLASAFGSAPAIALALIVLFSAAANALLSVLCTWLVGAHTRIVSGLAFLLRPRDTTAAPSSRRCKRAALATFHSARDGAHVHGTRAPPSFAT